MLLLAGIILLSWSLVGAVIYRRTGSEVFIPSGSAPGRITAITWKHNEAIALEWYGGEPIVYRHFNGSTSLDIWTGALTILVLTRNHSGNYTAEINNKVIGTIEVRAISPVPKPTVSMQCNTENTDCTLTCEGNTTDAEPVTYSWHILGTHNYSKGQQINLTKEDRDPWYCCEMENPISSEMSEEFPNPFPTRNRMFILVPIILLLIGFAGICIYVKYKSSKGEKNKGTDEENPPDQIQTNGKIPGSSALTENSPKKKEEIEVQNHKSEPPESNNQTEESAEESNGGETNRALLEERNQIISVSA